MALDFSALQTELFARGFDPLNDAGAGLTRAKRWINDAMHEVDDLERWPYRMASTTGTSPVTVSDLGEIETVFDSNHNQLDPSTRGALLNEFSDLTTTGTADYFYLNGAAITAYPVTTLTLTINYFKIGPDLSGSTDAPLMPDRFRPVIVEGACARAYRDQDNQEMALVCQAEAERIVTVMREFYELQTGGSRVAVTFASGDW